jgi:hypothetical protein
MKFNFQPFFAGLLIVLFLIFVMAMIRMYKPSPENFKLNGSYKVVYNENFTQVIIIDQCEYIRTTTGFKDGGVAIIHKENCRNHGKSN